MKLIVIYSFLVLLLSCKRKDKIEYKYYNSMSESCKDKLKGFYTDCNLEISNYYYTNQKIEVQQENDFIKDSILFLKPSSFRLDLDSCISLDTNSSALIAIRYNKENEVLGIKKYYNVLSDKDENILYQEIEAMKNGFALIWDFGHSRKVLVRIEIQFLENDYFVDSITIEEWDEGKHMNKIKYGMKEFRLRDFRREYVYSLANI